jgi:acetyl-CoA carboxylase carboxyl transferase subunit alpha
MLDFEKPLIDLETKIQELKALPLSHQLKIQDEIDRLEKKTLGLMQKIYASLSPWQKVMVARHPERPKTKDYVFQGLEKFIPLSGDRCFGDDPAVLSGLAYLDQQPVIVMGHQKGHDTESRVRHNFGMAHPEGYRTAIRLMDLADRFKLPVIFFVDTPGAYAGMQAEERGQSQAIAACIEKSLSLKVPVLSVIIGEGGSGGAVAFASSNYIAMLEHSVYSVISPEGCASILWRTSEQKEQAAVAQKMTAQNLLEFKVIDEIIREPLGAAHRNQSAVVHEVCNHLKKNLQRLLKHPDLKKHRQEKFLEMGRIL